MKDHKEVVEELPCKLTDEERSDKGVALAGLHQQRLEIEEKKKTAMSDFNARIKKVGGDIHYLSTVVNSGKESRNVKCRMDYDWTTGKKTLIRLDTDEVVREEVISDFERQQHIQFVERENSKAVENAESEDWTEEESAEEIPVEDEQPEPCPGCGAPNGDDHGEECPSLTEEGPTQHEEELEKSGAEEAEESTREETCNEKVEQSETEGDLSCFGEFEAGNENCQKCSYAEKCYEETPEASEETETVPAEEQGEEPTDGPTAGQYQCVKCEGHFDEPKTVGEDDSTVCPLCEVPNWF